MFEIGRRIVSPIIFYKGRFYLFTVFIIMNLMVHNWLKRAMAGQLSMEAYAKTVKDKDHQMMIIHGDKHIGKEVGLVLAAQNPYLHEEVQEYVYEITRPYIKSDTYSGYPVYCKEESSIGILTAMSDNPIMSKEIISKLVDDLELIFDEVSKIPLRSYDYDMHNLILNIYSKYGKFLKNASSKHNVTKKSQNKIINIASYFSQISGSQHYRYDYQIQEIATIVDDLMSSLVSNHFINVDERLEIASQHLNPQIVSSFVKSEGVGASHVAGIISGSILKTDGINDAQINNRLKTMIGMVESVNFEDEKIEKLFFSQQFIDFFNKINSLRKYHNSPRHRDYQEFQEYKYYVLNAMAKRAKTEEARVNFFKIILNDAGDNNYYKLLSIHDFLKLVMDTGRISEEFVDLLFKSMDKESAFKHLHIACSNNFHLFKYVFDKYVIKEEMFRSSTLATNTRRWIKCCIDRGINCESQSSLLDYWILSNKELLNNESRSWNIQNILFFHSDNNYPLLFLDSKNKKCPEVVRKIISIGGGSFRNEFFVKRLSQVKLMIANRTWQNDSL